MLKSYTNLSSLHYGQCQWEAMGTKCPMVLRWRHVKNNFTWSQLCLLDGISNAHCMPIQKDSLDIWNRTSGITLVGAKLPSSSTCNIQTSEQNFTLSKYAFISPELWNVMICSPISHGQALSIGQWKEILGVVWF